MTRFGFGKMGKGSGAIRNMRSVSETSKQERRQTEDNTELDHCWVKDNECGGKERSVEGVPSREQLEDGSQRRRKT